MLSRTEQINLYKNLTLNSRTDNATLGDQLINSETQKIFSLKPWTFLRKSRTDLTEASVQNYPLPADFKMMETVTVTSGGFQYIPKEVKSRRFWDELNVQNTVTSTFASWYMIFNNDLYLFPIPSDAGSTITFNYFVRTPNLTQDDYTTGTIVSIANGATTVTGAGTSWNASMVGRYIRLTETSTANAGDGLWYKIASVTSATVLELDNVYLGTTISAGSCAYTIGQISLLPDGFHELPVYRSVAQYWTFQVPDKGRAEMYTIMADRLEKDLIQQFGRDSSGVMINDTDIDFVNPNLLIQRTNN